MILGIDCSRYAAAQPTGIEQYTDRVVEGLLAQADQLGYTEIRLYAKNATQVERLLSLIDKPDQELVQVRLLEHNRLWTVLWLTKELLFNSVDALFIPSHVLPLTVPPVSWLTVHGVEALSFPRAYSWWQRTYHRFSLRMARRKGTRLIAVSQAVKKDLMDHLGVDEEQVMVVYNGFDNQVPNSKNQTPKGKEKDLVQGDFILSVGRLEERKNQLRLVEAFEQIANEYPELNLVLVGGDGHGADRLRKRIGQSEVQGRIMMTGYLDTAVVRGLMEKAKVFAYPSLAEGFGIPILEAFSAGCPVLTSKGSACEEIGGGPSTGSGSPTAIYCNPKKPGSIADGLKKILNFKNKMRSEMKEAGKKRAAEFSWQRCVEGLVALLRVES